MTVAVNDIIDKAEITLLDEANKRWSAAELLGWLNSGTKAISARKPDVYVSNESFTLVEGTKQSIAAAVIILDITRNMGTDGDTPGDIISRVDKKDLDVADPSWHTATASATVKHWMYDPKDPTSFDVYPPQPAESFGYVDGVWCSSPPVVAAGANIGIDDIYEPVILDYILFRAYSKDGALAINAASRATAHAQLFLEALGSQEAVEEFVSRETKMGG